MNSNFKFIFILLSTFYFLFPFLLVQAANLTFVSDTISISAPSANANHIIRFTITNTVPASGRIIIIPEADLFTIPTALDYTDIDFLLNGTDQLLAVSPGNGDVSAIGISVLSGISGSITMTLNDTNPITTGSVVVIEVGTNATFGETGDKQIKNPSASGSYRIYLETYDAFNVLLDQANAVVAIILPVAVGDPIVISVAEPEPVSAGGGGAPGTVSGIGGGGGVTTYTPFPAFITDIAGTAVINSIQGGTVVRFNPDGSFIDLKLPIGFWTLATTFTITTVSQSTIASIAPIPSSLSIVGGNIYSILAEDKEGTKVDKFLKPPVITISYTSAQVAGFDERTLALYSLDQGLRKWELIPGSSVDTFNNKVSGSVEHLTIFTIMGKVSVSVIRAADFNKDGRVDLVDFSILLYNWGMPKNAVTDVNGDGKVDLVDFSILLYWWTG